MIVDIRMLSCFLVVYSFLVSNLSTVAAIEIGSTNKHHQTFLDKNEEKRGINTDENTGIQHRVIKAGFGCHHPTMNSEVIIDYEGRTLDGPVFDSSYSKSEPSLFSLGDTQHIIRGLADMLSRMVEGDKFEVFIPSEMGYGSYGNPDLHIGKGVVLIYTLELIEVIGYKETAMYCTVTYDDGNYGSEGCIKPEEVFILEASKWNLEDLLMEQRLLVKAESKPSQEGGTEVERDSKNWGLRRFHILKQLRAIKERKDEF